MSHASIRSADAVDLGGSKQNDSSVDISSGLRTAPRQELRVGLYAESLLTTAIELQFLFGREPVLGLYASPLPAGSCVWWA